MSRRTGPAGFPGWTENVGKMLAAQDGRGHTAVAVSCTGCDEHRPVDLERLMAAKGPLFSLQNKRYRCKLTAGCRGWNRFSYQSGVMRPLWSERQADLWIAEDERQRRYDEYARQYAVRLIREGVVRTDPAPPGIDQIKWAIANDRERRRLIRIARG